MSPLSRYGEVANRPSVRGGSRATRGAFVPCSRCCDFPCCAGLSGITDRHGRGGLGRAPRISSNRAPANYLAVNHRYRKGLVGGALYGAAARLTAMRVVVEGELTPVFGAPRSIHLLPARQP